MILPNGRCDLKFQSRIKNFKRIEKLNYKKSFYKLYIDKNDSVYDVISSNVVSWKTVEKGKKKISIPDQVEEHRDTRLFNKIKGNPAKIAITKIMAELDMIELLS